jgi:hypothetical protein
MRRSRWLVLILLAGACGAEVGGAGIDGATTGPRLDAAPVGDAPIDAKPCTGGDARMSAPDGSCLVMIFTPQTFANASAACTAIGAHLAILRDAQADAAAEALAGARDTFIGLTDQLVEGTFRWGDGSALAFTNWGIGEPNDGGGQYPEDCAIIAGVRGGKWDDRPCAPITDVGGGLYSTLCQY